MQICIVSDQKGTRDETSIIVSNRRIHPAILEANKMHITNQGHIADQEHITKQGYIANRGYIANQE